MKNELYIANMASSIDDVRLRELFGQYGEVTSVKFGVDEKSGDRCALVQMAAEKIATTANNSLNGQKIDGFYLAVSYPEYDPDRELFGKQRKAVEAIATELGETEKVPIRELEMMARQCGVSFLQGILKDTLEVEDAGGLIIPGDSPTRRTRGGVFFCLARYRMSPAVRHVVYNRKGKPPLSPDEQQAAVQTESESQGTEKEPQV